jgi:hypothetical protein
MRRREEGEQIVVQVLCVNTWLDNASSTSTDVIRISSVNCEQSQKSSITKSRQIAR